MPRTDVLVPSVDRTRTLSHCSLLVHSYVMCTPLIVTSDCRRYAMRREGRSFLRWGRPLRQAGVRNRHRLLLHLVLVRCAAPCARSAAALAGRPSLSPRPRSSPISIYRLGEKESGMREKKGEIIYFVTHIRVSRDTKGIIKTDFLNLMVHVSPAVYNSVFYILTRSFLNPYWILKLRRKGIWWRCLERYLSIRRHVHRSHIFRHLYCALHQQ